MTDIIKIVLSLIFDKARNVVSSELSEGDLTDEKFRKVIAREINEINKKLDALGRKDLLSSVEFLKEGLNRLLMAMQKKSMNSDVPTTSQNTELDTLTDVDGASTSQRRVNEAFTISNVIAKKFEVVSLERLTNAKKSFEASRKEATRAFSNEALSIDDRIMATELRIVSRILENFPDDSDVIGNDCLLYLQALHSLPAVREMYSVQFCAGLKSYFKSLFNKKDRGQKVKTIESINAAVFDFITSFTTKKFCNGVNWPTIQLRNEEENTFYSKWKIVEKHAELSEYRRIEARWPDTSRKRPDLMSAQTIKKFIIERRYLREVSCIPYSFFKICLVVSKVLCSATDEEHRVYVLIYGYKESSCLASYPVIAILVFESDGWFLKYITTTNLCRGSYSPRDVFAMQVRQFKIAVLHDRIDSRRVDFIDFFNHEKHTIFLQPHPFWPCVNTRINILNDKEIMVTGSDDKTVFIYTFEGQLKQTIHFPHEELFTICDIAYRAASKDVLVLTRVSQDVPEEKFFEQLSPKELLEYRLLVYSANGALKDSYGLSKDLLQDKPRFVNCSEGRVALVRELVYKYASKKADISHDEDNGFFYFFCYMF